MNNFNKELIVTPYDTELILDKGLSRYYKFVTEDNDQYIIYFIDKGDDNYTVSFAAKGNLTNSILNKGKIFKVLSTVVTISYKFIIEKEVNSLIMYGEDIKRLHIFERYSDKFIPLGYKKVIGKNFVMAQKQ
jgi:hypothetical protein